ncbi:MAG TPA: glycosyltransferase family 87 protein [Candidatus Limnocylindrales bacterium]|nr:glycosyltransferase family 87 protein [Candidatus Limnocylindrales bacterium]
MRAGRSSGRLRLLTHIGAWLLMTCVAVGILRSTIPPENVGPDFIQFWTAATLLVHHEDPYDPGHQAAIQRSLGWKKSEEGLGLYDFMPYYYPPWLGLACIALLPLGYPLAKMTWIVLAADALIAGALLLKDTIRGLTAAVAIGVVVLFGFSIKSVAMGQIAPLVVFLAALAWWLLDRRRDVAAGAALALLTIKPQLTLLAIAALLVWCMRRRRWRVVGMFAATLAALGAVSAAFFPGWLRSMLSATTATPMPTKYFPGIGTTWYSVLDAVGIHGMNLVIVAAVTGAVLIVALMEAALRKDTTLEHVIGLGLIAPFFVAPYARAYDFPVLLIPALALIGSKMTAMSRGLMIASLTVLTGLHIAAVTTNWEPAIVGVRRPEFTYFWIPLLIALVWLAFGGSRTASESAALESQPLRSREA